MRKKIAYTPVSIFAAGCGAIASVVASSNPITAASAVGIGSLASAIAGGIELKDDEAGIKETLDRSVDEAWNKINADYRISLHSEDCLIELKHEIMGKSTSVEEFVRNMNNQGFEDSIAVVIQGILEKHKDELNNDPVIKWNKSYTFTAAKAMASILVAAITRVFQENDTLMVLMAIAESRQTILEKVEDKGDQILEEIRKAVPNIALSTEAKTTSCTFRPNDTSKKVYTITTNSIFDDLKVETDKNIAIFKDIYVQDENEDYLIELRDADTHRKYTYQSRAIDMFVHDVMSPLKGIKGYFDIYLINSMHGKHYSSGSYDYVVSAR